MDVQMPTLDGLEATRRICRHRTPERRPRIIALTADASPEDRALCLGAGMSDVLGKPVRSADLIDVLGPCSPPD
jgi:CheY-like chemotaxis protein